ncbi:AraC-type DNA-binding protein [Micromonospora phaseoli]|uniref:AraC-type DNA-binding protein n=1 Tax=Micromonospora phaseoli TaxID=1144548 RepID=A0A1H7C198_9ACTN|nr:AraC family transcriptional regulator [Micromonospora phaseoli]PZV92671.1 AraC family transcriptional regulator [Micromonospora phaseoli]GIJ76675.1 AraC family transcriptional regulator [Micromonospora phaseoli]SEJ83589.1 AraC-type DNA-binding protein [Micromonospora phaseoli]
MTRRAYSFVRTFAPGPARDLSVDRHYLLCASAGVLRLEAQDQAWLLPPARAALIEAGRPIRVSIPHPVTTASVLFDVGFTQAPRASLTVFDLSPLARALVTECGRWGESDEPLTTYAETLFAALAAVTWRLAEQPSPVVVPAGRSPELRRALRLTEQRLGSEVRFEDVAGEVGLAPRSLARRFEEETGMTWRAVLRRMRVLRAIEELAAGDTQVTKVAYTVGYTSLSAFNAAFRELTGRTPTQYRASFRP